MIKFKFDYKPADRKYITSFSGRADKGLLSGVRQAMFYSENKAKSSFGQTGHLKARTGHLRRSIKSEANQKPSMIIGRIFSNIIYARIHELGGVIKPKKGKYLKFQMGGHWIMVKKVKIPARPYLRPAIADHINQIKQIIIQSTIKAYN